jgi:hypothetical protein
MSNCDAQEVFVQEQRCMDVMWKLHMVAVPLLRLERRR